MERDARRPMLSAFCQAVGGYQGLEEDIDEVISL